ncbi:UNVERIFIED_CONTAM: hypothetical protein Slati_3162400 [Sesamum latifolium]|uniref:Uncharacterized protein n=1 Tax=Sesamum latifolium TaxID=2727402 RepID=A0AAW2UYJ9_9LAMI
MEVVEVIVVDKPHFNPDLVSWRRLRGSNLVRRPQRNEDPAFPRVCPLGPRLQSLFPMTPVHLDR